MEKEITVIEARDIIKSGEVLQLIDVRSQEAFEDFSLPGFFNVPLNKISQEIPNLDSRKRTLLMCQDGSQSSQALTLLESCGINAQVVRGGHNDWKRIISTPL